MESDPREVTVRVEPRPELASAETIIIACLALYEDDEHTRLRPMTRKDAEAFVDVAREAQSSMERMAELIGELPPKHVADQVVARLRATKRVAATMETDARYLAEHGIEDYMGMLHWRCSEGAGNERT